MGKSSKKEKEKDNSSDRQNSQDDAVSITDDVRGAEYYHGLIPRMDAEPLLKKEGDFLLRKTEHSPGQSVKAETTFTFGGSDI
ncbi:hypothetical protein OESDEN_13690 [Oesophagostomum dentatum]|uniref:SH2 domain-containing protein n=1 Tax=Oesophagostomum dentatum TaxID=61180 RepID=A0A0B1SMJ7_OESDE|nr:hypothetical protein OESDEN_13690 [Oesophagostomum dentatum]